METDNFKSGFVTLIGRPNVGKSTLLNNILKARVSIISDIPQTTRYQIRGILNLSNAQIIFVDTPGIHLYRDSLAKHLNTVAKKALEGVDIVLYVVDTSRPLGREEENIMNILVESGHRLIMALNKTDLGINYLNDYIKQWQDVIKHKGISCDPLIYYLPVSALTGKNLDVLVDVIVENLPQDVPYYERDRMTDFPLNFQVADIIREELLHTLKKEVPHSIGVNVVNIDDRDNIVYIETIIYVQRNSQKSIILGRKGAFIKLIGVNSREKLELIFGKKVYLDLRVKVYPKWQKNIRVLKELGYWWA